MRVAAFIGRAVGVSVEPMKMRIWRKKTGCEERQM